MHVVMIGGSDAGISAALRARELDPAADVTVVLEDAYPNFSICGIPYYVSGEVTHWRNLAHRRDGPHGRLVAAPGGGGGGVGGNNKLAAAPGAAPAPPPIGGVAGPGAL